MFLNYIALLTAISISSVAAYYSIYGLTAIFSGVFWPIVIMGSVLEVGKIVTTVWLHTYWQHLKWMLKSYMSLAVIVLMFITSMGIFGFLSRAHIEVTSQAGNGDLLIQQVELSISTEQKRIDDARAVMKQMDDAITGLLKGSGANAERDNNRTAAMTTQATKLRESQKKEREALNKSIDDSNKRIAELNKDKLKLKQEDLKMQAEVGPIKYIAQLIYDDELPGQSILEKAVRWVIIIIVAVFDPLAVAMVLGVTMVMNKRKEERELQAELEAQAEAVVHSETVREVEVIKEVPVIREVEVIKEIEVPVEVIREVETVKEVERIVEIEVPVEVIKEVLVPVENTEKLDELNKEIKDLLAELEQKDQLLAARAIEKDVVALEPVQEAPRAASILPELEEELAIKADDLSSLSSTTFGTEFPMNPKAGDVFLRLDMWPNHLYKFNGFKWITVDKNQSIAYTYEKPLIKMWARKLNAGEIDWDDLTPAEQDAVAPYLEKGDNSEG